MKTISLTLFSILIALMGYTQNVNYDTCVTIKPDWESGVDAVLHGLASEVNVNYGTQPQFAADAWTFMGTPGVVRSVIDFQPQLYLPAGAQLTSATLRLYGITVSGYGFGQHSSLSGSNACWIERVVSPWYESTVTWATQPQTTTLNRVSLAQSTSNSQVYTVNVTQLVLDMLQNPQNNYGFMIKLKNEQYYRRMNFYSSDYAIDSLRPELEICFMRRGTSIQNPIAISFNVFPNPTSENLNIQLSQQEDIQLELVNVLGKTVFQHNYKATSLIQISTVDFRLILAREFIS
ncbi:MAG: hypothetical protein DSY76_01190 [Bacteroidetes bacterium]|nr:MAG: hypothetical protein DSY76_01190 [Bacteroidota bacterium]